MLVFFVLKESVIFVFFICSFVVNIFINMELVKVMDLNEEFYVVFILLGVMINMGGAVIMIIIMILVVVYILGMFVLIYLVLLLSIIVVVFVCGVLGIVGGFLLLILFVCSLFGIFNDIVM